MEKEYLKLNFQKAVTGYVVALCKQWGLNISDGYWVEDEIGGIWVHAEGGVSLNLRNMIYCVEKGVAIEDYSSWREHNRKCLHFHLETVSLKSWLNGERRVSQKTFERLEGLGQDMLDAIEEEKGRY